MVTISLISVIANEVFHNNGEQMISAVIQQIVGEGIGTVSAYSEFWTPDDLKRIKYLDREKAFTKSEIFGGLLWTAVWGSVYFNASKLIRVYVKGVNGFEFSYPVFNEEVLHSYWPLVVLVMILEFAVAIFKWMKQQWTLAVAIFNLAVHTVSSVVLVVLLRNPNLFSEQFRLNMRDLRRSILTRDSGKLEFKAK
ncbi:hypothetical protein [Paenibacillus sp. CAA11]|uniref:hypothetical protein n=1 Tax=Paenibacillus sp. CAA11 TaxID=1532905 RepID=UPI001F2D84F3|nr:hypothetical protein [Paenibacillus sp. CAA11]